MARTAILTREVLAGVPALVEQGLRKGDIAERLGCKESTLVVRCSIAGISLRGPKRLQLRPGVSLTLSRETIASLSARAAADGCSEVQLASDLLETIARDGLYDAVLDSAPLAPDTENFPARTYLQRAPVKRVR
jgi:hypothetical protein